MHKAMLALASIMLASSQGASAGKSPSAADKLLDSLVKCQLIGDSSEKMACYDARVDELKAARANDKTFLSASPKREKFSPIDATATNVAEVMDGQWLLVLSNGSIWRTTESIRFEPRKGDKVHVAKGSLGSYLANIADQRAVRVRPLR